MLTIMLNYEPITNVHPPPRAIPPPSLSGPTRSYQAVSSSSSLSSSSTITVIVCHRRHRCHHGVGCCFVPSAATVILILVRHPHPCCPTPPQPHQRQNHRSLAPVLLPPCDPPPPHRLPALSALSIAHGAILDWHAASTPSGTTRRVPIPPVPPLSKDGPIVPAPLSRPPRCLRSPLRQPELDPPSLLGPPPPVGRQQRQHVDIDARPWHLRHHIISVVRGIVGVGCGLCFWDVFVECVVVFFFCVC